MTTRTTWNWKRSWRTCAPRIVAPGLTEPHLQARLDASLRRHKDAVTRLLCPKNPFRRSDESDDDARRLVPI